jgi:hypothetical protein
MKSDKVVNTYKKFRRLSIENKLGIIVMSGYQARRASLNTRQVREAFEMATRSLNYNDIVTVINAGPNKPEFMQGLLIAAKLMPDRTSDRILISSVMCLASIGIVWMLKPPVKS